MKLAIAIPAFQAASSVGAVVTAGRAVVPDVLVVDDGSTDGTGEAAAAAGAEVIRLATNTGKGGALRAAFARLFGLGFDTVATVDADGQHLPSEIPRLLDVAASSDLVLGTRRHLFDEMSGVRRVANTWSSRAISLAAGQRIPDVQTGFRLYSQHLILRTGFPESRFEAESAVVVRAVRLGFRITSVPIRLGTVDGRASSHYRPIIDSVRIATAVIGARVESRER
jgi:glycosyltransferase involved in cell wall biosynthesis